MLQPIVRQFKDLGLSIGVQSVVIKGVTAVLRLILAGLVCRHFAPNQFVDFVLFLGFTSIIPFLDLGVGGIAFRRKLVNLDPQDLVGEEHLFFETFSRMFKLFGFYAILALGIKAFIPSSNFNPICALILFMRIPFILPNEYLFSKLKMRLVYSLEVIEHLLLVAFIGVGVQFLAESQLELGYAAVMAFFTLGYFSIFIRKKGWKIRYIKGDFQFSSDEWFHSLQAFLAAFFLVFIPYVVNHFNTIQDTYEFNIGFRLISIALGASLVVFNALFTRFLQIHQSGSRLPLKPFFTFLSLFVGFVAVSYFAVYEKTFQLMAGFSIENPLLHHLLFLWSICVFLFLGLDQILKTYSVRFSALVWIVFYFTSLVFVV